MICKKLFMAVGLVGLATQVHARPDEAVVVVPLCVPGLPDCDIQSVVGLMAATGCNKHEQGSPAALEAVLHGTTGTGIEQPCKAQAEATADKK
ncbi:hypothetical protein [Oligoflexus tunisiensis]|uniref:hypothetical protein n=1 Tax=Oligoflexus tunisiensis TaxID=708132 RepID=UPI00114CBA3C|nr:hypothetical protein [Oligoflexus tunisiensis]